MSDNNFGNIDISVETIAAISTPPGRGGIGIVRLSGPEALPIAAKLARTERPLEHARARVGVVLDPSTPSSLAADDSGSSPGVDEALVTAFLGPRSYTGEDLVEIAAHGSPVVLETVLQAALGHGARLARPGEFTERAFLSGRLDLTQAEAVHDLIAAQTLDQARTAARQLGGALSKRIAPVKEQLFHLLALLEAGMDFASGELDDVEAVPPAEIAARLAAVIAPLEVLAASFRVGQLRRNGASLAIIGLPNAGKSSLFNRLLLRDRAIVTPVAGTTRDTLEEALAIDGVPLRLVDTAGLREIGEIGEIGEAGGGFGEDMDPEALGIARSREAMADADLILLVHDATLALTAEERTLAEKVAEQPHVLVSNKVDLPGAAFGWESPEQAVAMSAVTGAGLEELRGVIVERLGLTGDGADAGGLNTLRQQEAAGNALAALRKAAGANLARLPHEFLLLDLHVALRALDSLTGETTADDILARIFSTFCIGK